VQRIGRVNRFDWTGPANTGEDSIRHCHKETAPLEAAKRAHCGAFLVCRQPRRAVIAIRSPASIRLI
jgi:hypothetical protein